LPNLSTLHSNDTGSFFFNHALCQKLPTKKTSPLLDFGITGGFFTTETTFRAEDADPDSNKVVTTRLG